MNKTCGKCGRRGHNRRTCGKSVTPSTDVPNKATLTHSKVNNSRRGVKGCGDVFSQYEKIISEQDRETGSDNSTSFNYEDLETLWVLKGQELNARDIPKGKRSYTLYQTRRLHFEARETLESLTNFIKEYENTNISAKDWYKFFHNFPPELKEQLATEEFANQRIYFALANDRSSIVQRKIVNNTHVEREVLGSVLYKTLQKKPSMVTLETVVILSGRSQMENDDLHRMYTYLVDNSVDMRNSSEPSSGYGFRGSNSWGSKHAERTLRRRLISNIVKSPKTSAELFQQLVESGHSSSATHEVVKELVTHNRDSVRDRKVEILRKKYQPLADHS